MSDVIRGVGGREMRRIRHKGRAWHFPADDTHFTGKNKKGRFMFEDYQTDRLKAAYKHVQDFTLAVDVGAHIGLMALKMAEKFKTVYAFEPDPVNYACLQANTRDTENIIIVNAALGDKRRRVKMDRPAGNSGDCQVDESGDEIDMFPLDEYDLPDLGFMKIDVQGYEHLVLRGAKDLIQGFSPVILAECEPPGKLRKSYDGGKDLVDEFFKQQFWRARCAEKIKTDRIYVPDPSGYKPYTKYEEKKDYHWKEYAEGRSKFLDELAAYINAQGHQSVLDLGCGDGMVTSLIRNAFGIDDNLTAINLAKKHKVPCQHLPVQRIKSLGRSWDAVMMMDILEHLPRQAVALRAVAAVTKTLYVLNPEPSGTHWHFREFTGDDAVKFLASHGWRTVHRKSFRVGKNKDKNADKPNKTFIHAVYDES